MSLFRRKIPVAYIQATPEVRKIIATSHLDRILPLFDVPDEALDFIRRQAAGELEPVGSTKRPGRVTLQAIKKSPE
jgi:hypothetical protein